MGIAPQNPLICIPARLAATRLPQKPILDIEGVPAIVRVWRQAMKTGLEVIVACDDQKIAAVIAQEGGKAVLTGSHHHSGSDRIYEAAEIFDPEGHFEVIINVQGDLPTIDPLFIQKAFDVLKNGKADVGTLVVPLKETEYDNPHTVKAILDFFPEKAGGTDFPEVARAFCFLRTVSPPDSSTRLFQHIGLYAWRREALKRFVESPPSYLEEQQKLEQLRALALGMRIDAAIVDATPPPELNTPEDLVHIRQLLAG